MQQVYLREDLATLWSGLDPFEQAFALQGDMARDIAQRQTLRTDIGPRSYYIKRHYGVGWAEILKNWLTAKRPVLSAENEYRAVTALWDIGVRSLPIAGYGVRGANPASRQSFLITDDLTPCVSLEDYCLRWPEEPPSFATKFELIKRVAEMARLMHGCGINHRDFYICHFLLVGDGGAHAPLHLIDLHRAEQRSTVPPRWLAKDLGGLYFSAFDIGLTRRDVLRFVKAYFGGSIREVLQDHQALIQSCEERAQALYAKTFSRNELPRQVAGLTVTKSPFAR